MLPDPNPPFDQFTTNRFNYPYTLRNNLTGHRADHAWRAIYLENEYLKCSVLPDIGGHLYTCIDKISGKPMFYANPSIKKAAIAYRGAWAAFGIEFNFPGFAQLGDDVAGQFRLCTSTMMAAHPSPWATSIACTAWSGRWSWFCVRNLPCSKSASP